MISSEQYFSLGKWLELADDAYIESKELMYKKISTKKPLYVPAYLLHWSIELYLKAFLMQYEKPFERGTKGHDLLTLFSQCLEIDSTMEYLSQFTKDEIEKQSYWLDLINEYGKEQGGVRYLNKNRKTWSFFVLIHDRLDNLVAYIKKMTNPQKDITQFL